MTVADRPGAGVHPAERQGEVAVQDEAAAENPFVAIRSWHRGVVGAVLFVYFPIVLAVGLCTTGAEILPLWGGFLLYLIVSFLPFFLWRREVGLLHPLVFKPLWTLVNAILRQTPMLIYGLEEHSALPSYSSAELTSLAGRLFLLNGIGSASLLVGYIAAPTIGAIRFAPRTVSGLSWKIPVLLLVSGACFAALYVGAGGLEGLLLRRAFGLLDRTETPWMNVARVFLGTWLCVALVWLSARPSAIGSVSFWLVVGTGVLLNYLSTGSRGSIILPILLILIVHCFNTRRVPVVRLLLVLLGSVVVVGALGLYRYHHFGKTSVDDAFLSELTVDDTVEAGVETLVSRATTEHGALPILAKVPEESPLLLGKSYLAMLLAPFPSAILPFNKPLPSGFLNGWTFFGVPAGVPTGTVGEAYWNFHVPGVIAVYFFWGVVTAIAVRLFRVNAGQPAAIPLLVQFIMFGDLNGTDFIPWVQTTVLTLLVCSMLCRASRGYRSTRPA